MAGEQKRPGEGGGIEGSPAEEAGIPEGFVQGIKVTEGKGWLGLPTFRLVTFTENLFWGEGYKVLGITSLQMTEVKLPRRKWLP